MDNATRPSYRRDATLRDGTPIVIRSVRRDDRQRLIDAFHKLEPETLYTRFFSMKTEVTEADLARIDASDFVRSVILVATLEQGGDETIIGASSMIVQGDPVTSHSAEVSFTIEEDFQGQGLAGQLLADMTVIARERGLHTFEAVVLGENTAMLRVFRRSGLAVTTSRAGGEVLVTMDLRPGAAAPPTKEPR